MKKYSVREAREQFASVLDTVASGEEVVVTRRGRATARIVGVTDGHVRFPDRSALRAALPPMTESASESVRRLRDQERY